MPTRYSLNASRVSCGSQLPVLSKAFCPARSSVQKILRAPPYAFSTAASNTRTEALQISGPMPSPSIKGITGLEGTSSLPSRIVIFSPCMLIFLRCAFVVEISATSTRFPPIVNPSVRGGGSPFAGRGVAEGIFYVAFAPGGRKVGNSLLIIRRLH